MILKYLNIQNTKIHLIIQKPGKKIKRGYSILNLEQTSTKTSSDIIISTIKKRKDILLKTSYDQS